METGIVYEDYQSKTMLEIFKITFNPYVTIVVNTILVYIFVILLTRLNGKRSFSKMSSFDFAMTIAVGSVIASTLILSTVSFVEGAIGLVALFGLQYIISRLRLLPVFKSLTDNSPLYIMKGSKVLHENLKKARISEDDLKSKLREANVIRLEQVKAVVLEATGDVSVLHTEADFEVDEWIISDVDNPKQS